VAKPSKNVAPAPATPTPPAPARLSPQQIERALAKLPEWSEAGDAIQRTYALKDFIVAMKFVNAVAEEAERVQHHPDILIRYRKVTLTLATHDSGGITEKDIALATTADAMAQKFAAPEPTIASK
jgi:4a-hydroxytetrahydrobiopterin dehydratase